uniref:G8 domain-containing protein n=1 Tax=Anisakis simplex TaxID=6269 RepID=A0A0M3IYI4_ANISI
LFIGIGRISYILASGVTKASINLTCGTDSSWYLSKNKDMLINTLSCLSLIQTIPTTTKQQIPIPSPSVPAVTTAAPSKTTPPAPPSTAIPPTTTTVPPKLIPKVRRFLSCECVILDRLNFIAEKPFDLSVSCKDCPNLRALHLTNLKTGITSGNLVIDHDTTSTGCRCVDIHCSAFGTSSEQAAIVFDGDVSSPFAIATNSVKSSLCCNKHSQWTHVDKTLLIVNISCILLPAKNTTENVTTTKAAPVTTTAHPISPLPPTASCTTCLALKVAQVNNSMQTNGMIVMDRTKVNQCIVLQLSCSSGSTTAPIDITEPGGMPLVVGVGVVNTTFFCSHQGQWLTLTGKPVKTVLCVIPKAICRECSPVVPLAILNSSVQNGNLFLDHYFTNDGCKAINIDCFGSSADQAEIIFNGNYTAPVATGRGSISMVIKCTKSKVWAVGDRLLVSTDVTTAVTTPTSHRAPCLNCVQLHLGTIHGGGWTSGTVVTNSVPVNGCALMSITCINPHGGNTVQLRTTNINSTLVSGTGTVHTVLFCNSLMQWQTLDGTVVTGILCAAKPPCRSCPSLEPYIIPPTVLNNLNGNLAIVQNFAASGCRYAVVTCSGLPTHLTMIGFNGNYRTAIASGIGKASLQLVCTNRRVWSRSGSNDTVKSLSCVFVDIANVTIPPSECTECSTPLYGTVTTPGFESGILFTNRDTNANGCSQIRITCTNPVVTRKKMRVDPHFSGDLSDAQGHKLFKGSSSKPILTDYGSTASGNSCDHQTNVIMDPNHSR